MYKYIYIYIYTYTYIYIYDDTHSHVDITRGHSTVYSTAGMLCVLNV